MVQMGRKCDWLSPKVLENFILTNHTIQKNRDLKTQNKGRIVRITFLLRPGSQIRRYVDEFWDKFIIWKIYFLSFHGQKINFRLFF